MARPTLFVDHDNYRGDGSDIPSYLLSDTVAKALQAFQPLSEFQYVEFHLGKPTYVFLMADTCPLTPYQRVTVSITDRGDMKYVFVANDPRPDERWWIVYQPVDDSGTPISTERCVGWFVDEFSALENARDILAKPDRQSRVN